MNSEQIRRVVRASGGAKYLALRFNISTVSVHEWIQKGRIPAERAPSVVTLAAANGSYFDIDEVCPPVQWQLAKKHMNAARRHVKKPEKTEAYPVGQAA